MKVTLAQAGIVAGILTLAWSVGGTKEVYSAHTAPIGNYPYFVFNSTSKAHAEKVASLVPDSIVGSRGPRGKETWIVKSKTPSHEARSYFQPWLRENDYFRSNQFLSEVKYEAESLEMIECGNCDATFTIDEGLDIGGIDYCEECYDTISVKEDTEWRWNNGEKVLCCCGEPTRDADFCPEGGYNRSGDECKFECGHEECEAEMKAKYGAESFEARGTWNLYKSQEKVLKAYRDSGGKENHYDSLPIPVVNKLESIRNSETLWSDVNRWLSDNPSTSKNPYGGFHSSWDAESEDENIVCASHLDGWRYCDEDMDGRAYPEPCVVCDKKYCKNCWKRGERKDNICERCYTASGARKIDDEERWQRYLKLQEERRKSMGWLKRKWHGLAEESLGKDSCCCGATKDSPCDCMVTGSDCNQDCACATPSCPLCDEKIDFVDAYEEPMNYDLCDGCEDAVQEKRYDHAHSAESKKLNPIEKPIISGAASGATIEGLEDLMMSEWVDEHGFRWHLVSQDYAATHWRDEEIFWIDESDGTESLIDEDTYEAYLSPDWADEKFGKELGWNLHEPMSTMMSEGYTGHYSGGAYEECWDMLFFEMADTKNERIVDRMEEIENEVIGKYEDKAAETSQEDLAELRTKLSKQRTAMSAMRTALAGMGLYLAYDTYRDHKKSQ